MRSISEMSYANIEIIFQKVLSFLCVRVYNICIEFVRGVFMKFCDKLNEYIETLSCTSKELCELSGISEATFSRYKRGERVPEIGTDAFENLCTAVSESAKRREREDITARSVRESFISCEDFVSADKEILRQNFNALIASLGINLTKLCRATNYDVSTVFRIRSGTRRPADPGQFADAIASFVAQEFEPAVRNNGAFGAARLPVRGYIRPVGAVYEAEKLAAQFGIVRIRRKYLCLF